MADDSYYDERFLLGRRLRAAREKAGLSQAELGTRLGWTQTLVSKVEGGERRRLDVFDVRAFAVECGTTLGALLAPWTPAEQAQLDELRRRRAEVESEEDSWPS